MIFNGNCIGCPVYNPDYGQGESCGQTITACDLCMMPEQELLDYIEFLNQRDKKC